MLDTEKLRAEFKKILPEADAIVLNNLITAASSATLPIPEKIIHRLGPNGFHQLEVDDIKSEWASPSDVIRVGAYFATTDSFSSVLPQVGVIGAFKNGVDFTMETVQVLPKTNKPVERVYAAD